MRNDSVPYELGNLRRKYFIQKGILMESLNKYEDAQSAFLECMDQQEGFDVRIRKECLHRLI